MSQTFLDCIRTIPDHRIVGLVDYPLDEILFATLVGVLCGADDFDDVESIGSELLDWLRGFLPCENGVASGQTFRRFFRLVDPKALEAAFAAWMASFGLVIRGVVAIDVKPCVAANQMIRPLERCILFRPMPANWVWCSARSRLKPRAMRSPPSPNCSTCWR
jgi:hypothetical protein